MLKFQRLKINLIFTICMKVLQENYDTSGGSITFVSALRR